MVETLRLLRENARFVILTHIRPDGDTLGSAAALCLGLRSLGKEAWVLENPQLTPKYAFLLENLTCAAVPEGALVVSVDVSGDNRKTGNAPIDLCIDHHGVHEVTAGHTLNRPECAACGEIIFEILDRLDVALTREMALALYVAISTDTGCFRHSNVTANTFRVAAGLLGTGLQVSWVNHALFGVRRLARLRLEAELTRTMQLFGSIGICTVPYALMEELGLIEDDFDDLSGFARTVEGVRLAVMLRQQADGSVRVSLRSERPIDSAAICKLLGGGGHVCAAGCTLRGDLESAQASVIEAIQQKEPELFSCQTE